MPVSNFVSWLKVRALKIELCFFDCKYRAFLLSFQQKLRLKMLITCKKGTNETLKNPENAPFLHFFALF